jgi:predicted NBD/HSP70 family sugar kinase
MTAGFEEEPRADNRTPGRAAMTSGFDDLLSPSELKKFGVGTGTVAEVFARIVMAAPDAVPQVDIANAATLPGLAELPQGSVSRASNLLLHLKLLVQKERLVVRPGRPIIPLKLGPDWGLIGVRIHSRGGRPAEVAGVLAPLDGTGIDAKFSVDVTDAEDHEALVKKIVDVVRALVKNAKREVLGVGVELGAHVHQGRVTLPSFAGGSFPLGEILSKALPGRPIVVDNDVNARAALQIWRKDAGSTTLRFPERDFVVVAVFEERVGGALVIDRRVYRGHRGRAGEIGHLTVDYARPRRCTSDGLDGAVSGAKGFDDPCLCVAAADPAGRGYGHVDALATPVRIAGELGIDGPDFGQAAREPGTDQAGHTTRIGEVFRIAGEALGRGIAAMVNVANPGNLLLLLPPELAEPTEGSAAAQYTQAIEHALDRDCFTAAASDARAGRPTLQIEPMDPEDLQDALPARVSVLDRFIAHARGEESPDAADATST